MPEHSGTLAIGVDIGGASVRVMPARDEDAGARWTARRFPVDRTTRLVDLLDECGRLLNGFDPTRSAAVAIAVPTFVDGSGRLLAAPSMPALTNVRLAQAFATRLSRPLPTIVPDMTAAVIGEATRGTGRGVGSFLCVALGTGANAAATRDGRVVETAFGCLGDAGHVLVEPDGPECACGGRGCLEAVASGWALAREARTIDLRSAADLSAAADDGDDRASRMLERAGVALGRAVSTWSAMVWPDVVAVAGGVAQAGERLLAPARRELTRVGAPYIIRRVRLVRAELGDTATIEGAALMAVAEATSHARH